ncbi:uncharacterized protein M421DRAFT_60224 [Didymella exigua CBS 183.55]|uniref:Ubiquitin-like domain-containing protein n=1 Tax=Didymella exigua CBS 183.55 TaxID=1150837 RepID=A0A6A5RRG7_9PLEO|nr:uncharacterized protein M421DRAFT_60224 [Didymella exigua CBS 183.55]KAF1929768.1 hypothetical protein M421DRAFT_60224 [Didymella exigua CBS 183.55]
MTDATSGAPAPKKRSLFKRAAWQDAGKKENEDIFSHSNEFSNIVAEENRQKEEAKRKLAEAKRKVEEEQRREQTEKQDRKGKRRKVSIDYDEPILLCDDSAEPGRIIQSRRKGRTSLSPAAPVPPPKSLVARYDNVARTTRSQGLPTQPIIVDLGPSDDDEDSGYKSKSFGDTEDDIAYGFNVEHGIALRTSNSAVPDDDDLEEVQDPELAAIEARARARAAANKAAAASGSKAPIAELFIASELPDTNALMVKVRIDSTIEKSREAWCARQNFTTEMTRDVFFTWRGTRIYDSTTVRRLGVKVDDHGNISIEGDDSIYDQEGNTPKIHVEAWTDIALAQHKREVAAEEEAKRKAAEPTSIVEERDPTPEPVPEAKKYRLFLKARGMEDFRIQVKPDTTFEKLANAFKASRKIAETQPLTLMFDGERLSPMDTIADSELEDMDSIDVLLR